jgi:hypothetical protein
LFADILVFFPPTRGMRRLLQVVDREAMAEAVGTVRGEEMVILKASKGYRY